MQNTFTARPHQRAGLPKPVSQVVLSLRHDGERAPFDMAHGIILEWMAEQAGGKLPEEACEGKSFTLYEADGRKTEAIALPDPRRWVARLDDPDRDVDRRIWTTGIDISEQGQEHGGSALLKCRLSCVTDGENPFFDPFIPGLVHNVVERLPAGLEAGRPASVRPWFIDTQDGITDLVSLLRYRDRHCNVIVFSLPEGSSDPDQTAVSARAVARRTAGAAHVAVVTGQASFWLTDQVGKEFSVYRQAIRTYRPGFDPDRDELRQHPCALPDRIASWTGHPGTYGPEAYENLLVSQALAQSVSGQHAGHRPMSLAEARHIDAEAKRKDAQPAAPGDREGERKKTQEEYDSPPYPAGQGDEKMQEALRRAQEQNRRLRYQNRRLRHHIDSLGKKLKEAGQSPAPIPDGLDEPGQEPQEAGQSPTPIPDSLDGFREWCRAHLTGTVKIHKRAFRSIKKSMFEDVPLIYRSLLLLRDHYVPMRYEGGLERKQAFEDACHELGIEEQPAFSGTRHGEEGENYKVSWGGRKVPLDRHLTKGNSRDERYCFRLYFFWDEDGGQVVVGWLPSHLPTRIS